MAPAPGVMSWERRWGSLDNKWPLQSAPTDIKRERVKTRFLASPLSSSSLLSANMPPLRTPLGSISGNRLKGCEISPYMRGQVAGKASECRGLRGIATDLKLDYSTVRYTLKQDELRHEGESLPRAHRKKSYTDADERNLLRHVRLNPKDTYKQVIIACGLDCKTTTVKKILKQHGIANWRCKQRPELTEAHALKRLAWCLARPRSGD
jgi:hypothetical protein